MSRLLNLKKQAAEAAESDFLWYLGYLAPSRHKADDVCVAWGLSSEDRKRVTSVTYLRDNHPDILSEIRSDPADEPSYAKATEDKEEEMAEVVLGEKHFKKIAEKKDRELWEQILSSVGVPTLEALKARVETLNENRDEERSKCGLSLMEIAKKRLPSKTAVICRQYARDREDRAVEYRGVRISRPGIYWGTDSALLAVNTPEPDLIRIRPSHLLGYMGRVEIREGYMVLDRSFYARHLNGGYYWSAAIFVEDKSALALAKRLAEAYERETKRRRKPAKAVVVKNY